MINLRSFHWTVFHHPAWETCTSSRPAIPVPPSLAAAAYPAWLVPPDLPPDPAPGGVTQAAEKGPSAALRFSPRHCGVQQYASFLGARKPCIWTFLSSLPRVVPASRGAGTAAAAGDWAAAEGTRTWSFPRDHGAHPEARTEWWYLTAILADGEGRRFGVPADLLPQGLDPAPPEAGDSPLRARQAVRPPRGGRGGSGRFRHAERVGRAGASPAPHPTA